MAAVTGEWKRPSTTRRNIKVENFDIFESAARLRRIRGLLGDGTPLRLDGLLLVLGVDSKHSYAMRELANYLFFGFFDLRETEYEAEGYDDFVIEDLVILIMKDVVHVYTNPINYRYFEPYMAAWRGLRVWCLSDQFYEQEDLVEDFKIRSFVSLMSRCTRIGVPFNHSGYSEVFDKMEIEKYPLIQAFASDEFSNKGFFTLNYDVFDISENLHGIYSDVDPVLFSSRVLKDVKQFENQWSEFFQHMEEATQNLPALDERKVMEPFSFYFNHGKLALTNFAKSNRSELPFVLFGSHSKKSNFEKSRTGGRVESVTLGTAGRTGKTAKHMVLHAIAPNSPLRCSRTYFFGYDHEVTVPSTGQSVKSVSFSIDMQALNILYLITVDLVKEAIEVYVKTLSVQQAKTFVMQKLPDKLRRADIGLPGPFVSYLTTQGSLEFSLKGFDINGMSIELKEKQRRTCLKNARIIVYDVPSIEYKDKYLGSIVFSETFLDSHFDAVEDYKIDGHRKTQTKSNYLILTERVPVYFNWAVYKQDRQISAECQELCTRASDDPIFENPFGKLFVHDGKAQMTSFARDNIRYNIALSIFEKGFIINSEFNGSIVIPFSEISKISFHDSQNVSKNSVLSLEITSEFRVQKLPPTLNGLVSANVIITFQPRSQEYYGLYKYAIDLWSTMSEEKSGDQKWFEQFKTIDENSALNHFVSMSKTSAVKPQNESENLFSSFSFSQKYLGSFTGDVPRFLSNLKISSNQSIIAKRHLPLMLGSQSTQNNDLELMNVEVANGEAALDQCKVWVTIVAGLPWSHKGQLAENIVNMTKGTYKWVYIKAFDESTDFNVQNMQTNLTSIVSEWKEESKSSDSGILRLMIVPPNCVELINIVQAINSHPAKKISSHLEIQSVIYCVDQTRAYIKFNMTMPKLLDQCFQGLVNCIVFTGELPKFSNDNSTSRQDGEKLQSLLRNVNTKVVFVQAPNGNFTKTNEIGAILSENSFQDPALIKSRYFLFPNWYVGKFKTSPSEPFTYELPLTLKAPMEKHRLTEAFKSLTALENLFFVHGKFEVCSEPFGKGTITTWEVKFWVPSGEPQLQQIEEQKIEQGKGDVKTFCGKLFIYGHQLKEKVLKEILRKSVSPKPKPKPLRDASSLTEGEKKMIHKKRHLEKLPPGVFFNGTYFVSMDGEKSYWHPNFDTFVEDFLKTANAQIDAYNKKISQQRYADLFEG